MHLFWIYLTKNQQQLLFSSYNTHRIKKLTKQQQKPYLQYNKTEKNKNGYNRKNKTMRKMKSKGTGGVYQIKIKDGLNTARRLEDTK